MSGTKRVAVWGISGHSKVVTEILGLTGGYELVGYIDDWRGPGTTGVAGLTSPVLGARGCLDDLPPGYIETIALGFGHCRGRQEVSRLVLSKGFDLASAIHPRAIVSAGSEIDIGSVVAAGAVVNPGVVVGRSVILNTACSIDHDCVIGEAVHIAPGARLAGGVVVGASTWVGLGVLVKERVRIGAGCLIGAGSLVLTDMPDRALAYGSPARVVRYLTDEEAP